MTESPEKRANFLSQIAYIWFYRVLIKGWRRTLKFEDVYELQDVNTTKTLMEHFYKFWKPSAEDLSSQGDSEETISKGPSLMKAIMKSIGSAILLATVYRILSLVFSFTAPYLMRFLLQFVDSRGESQWKGFLLAVGLFVVAELDSLCIQRYLYHTYNFGMRFRTIITAAVYRKALRLSKVARRQTTVGEIVNLMSVDAQKLQEVPTYVSSLWSTVVTFIVCVGVLWQTVGAAVLSGMLMLVILVPFNGFYIGNRIRLSQAKQMKAKDLRIKTFNEVLSGIKLLKLYAWERIFQDKVTSQREVELQSIKWINFMHSVSAVIWYLSSYLVCVVIFLTYLLMSEENVLNADKIFFTISIVNLMKYPLSMLSLAVGYLGQSIVSMKRIRRFLLLAEIQDDATIQDPAMEEAVQICEGTFSWGIDMSPVLMDISLSISKGELVAVVGEVGSGKSSLISAILGETIKCKGSVTLSGNIAYVPQEAWILSKTLKDNILLDKPELHTKYQEVLQKCTLNPDIKTLSHGDETEIGEKVRTLGSDNAVATHGDGMETGEKGINLSGGQKQRVSLARAVYQDKDIYLLDDPLSAVDADVGKKLFENVIGPKGMLKGKTRILVTHTIWCLPQVDRIVVMQGGRIAECGTYTELMKKKGDFAEFLTSYLLEDNEVQKEEDLDQLKDILSPYLDEDPSGQDPQQIIRKLSVERRQSVTRRSIRRVDVIAKDKLIERKLSESVKKDQLTATEKEKEGNISLDVIWSYMKAAGGLWVSVILVFYLLSVVGFVLESIWLSSWANDADMAVNATQPNNTYLRLGVYAGYVGIQAFTVKIGSLGIAFGCYHASRSLHSKILHKIVRAPMMFFDTTPLGRIMNRCSKDMDYADGNIPLIMRSWFNMIVPLLSTMILITYSTPVFLAAGIPLIVVFVLSQRLYVKSTRQLQRINSVKRSPVFVHFDESIVGATSIRAYKRTDAFIDKCHLLIDDSQKAWYMILVAMRWLAVTMATLGNLITLFAALLVVIQRDSIGSGVAGLSISYSLQVSVYMYIFVKSTSSLETYLIAIERIKEYTEISSEAEWEIPDNKPQQSWPQAGKVDFSKYCTKYRPTLDNVLKGVSFKTGASEKIGVVGRTGAGKSSIALSLFRIIEATEGSISIDGLDISKIGLHDLRARLTIIPQDPVIFCGTLRNNLDPEEKFTDSEIWNSLELTHLKLFVLSLPEQLEYECGEGGDALSMGQKQLLCLSRALLRKSKILVLDEATSGIDMATDELIQATIRTAFHNCTVITIAHRLNTIIDYDRILVLDNGSVAEFDAPHVLLQKEDSIFYSMAKIAKLC